MRWIGCFALLAVVHVSAARAVTFSPGASVDVPPPYATGTVMSRVGCASPTLCVATDQFGHIYTSSSPTGDYTAWLQAQSPTTQPLGDVSCPTTSLCVTIGASEEVTSTDPGTVGSLWQAGTIDPAGDLAGISCASNSLCVAATSTGVVVSTDPAGGASTWVSATLSPSKPITAIACPSDDLCVAVDSAGEVLTSNDPTGGAVAWQRAAVDPTTTNGGGFTSLACASTTLCVAGDVAGQVFTTTDPADGASTWTAAEIDPQPPCYSYHGDGACPGVIYGVSCPTATACVAIDGSDHLLTSTNPTGGSGAWASTGTLGVESVTCPSTTLCLAPGNGSVLFSTAPFASGATFSQALYFDGNPELTGVSCRPAFCAAVDTGGHMHTTADPVTGPWTTIDLGAVGLTAISCPSAQLCATATASGKVLTSPDPTAPDPTWTTADLGLRTPLIDCPTTQFCLALGAHGHVSTSTDPTGGPDAWKFRTVDARQQPTDLACPTRHFCAVATDDGEIEVTRHPAGPASDWHLENIDPGQNPITVRRPVLESISCPSRSFCAVTDDEGHVITSQDPSSTHADWQRHRIYGNQPLGSITCASDALCVASDGGTGLLASTSPTALTKQWRSARFSTGTAAPLTSISCPTHTRCVAVSGADTYITGPTP